MEWSEYQEALFDNYNDHEDNLFVNAVAGSGKTTSLVGLANYVKNETTAIMFNKQNRTDFGNKCQDAGMFHVTAHTFNSWGHAILRQLRPRFDKNKLWKLLDFDEAAKFAKLKAVRLCKNLAIFTRDDFENEWDSLLTTYDIDLKTEHKDRVFKILMDSLRDTSTIDYDDQVAMPYYHRLPYDCKNRDVFVDESQDMNPINILTLLWYQHSRYTFVGDPYQAIYQFRGADAEAVKRTVKEFECHELPLSICYRCPEPVLEHVRETTTVKHIEGCGKDGEVKYADDPVYEYGDMVLCRTNAPLLKICLQYIAEGKRAFMRGTEIGESLITLCEKVGSLKGLEKFISEETERFKNRPYLLEERQDKWNCLIALWEECGDNIIPTIKNMFKDFKPGEYVLFSSIHRAKGLENDRIFILNNDKLKENNLKYVAYTRTKKELVL